MTISANYFSTEIEYPETDGLPMAESDQTRDYLFYAVEVLDIYFQNNSNVYVSGNLFIYYEQGNLKAVVAPDVFVVFGVLPDGSLCLSSEVLGLELRLQSGEMRFEDPGTGEKLLSYREAEQARREALARSQKLADKLRELGIDLDTV